VENSRTVAPAKFCRGDRVAGKTSRAGTLASIHTPGDKNNIWFPTNATQEIRTHVRGWYSIL
jgi:hypothetical protein